MSAETLITDHLDLWTEAITKKSNSGRGSNGKTELTGLKKLREFILELAIQGKLVTQVSNDGSAEQLLRDIENEIRNRAKNKEIRKVKKLPKVKVDEHPFPIPKSWAYCRLNEIGSWGSGATPKRGNPDYYGGPYPWFKSGELKDDFIDSSEERITLKALEETSVRLNKPGDVLIAMYGATIGKASILKVEATTNQAVCACSPWQGIANKYLLLLLKAYRSRFIAMGAGGAQPNISREKIISTVIGLPPEKEQVRIVQKVDELMALCDRLEQQTSDHIAAHDTLVDTLLGTLTQSQNATELAENWTRLAAHFDILFTTEQSIDKLKQTVLQLAVMGRLVEQSDQDESAECLLERIDEEVSSLVSLGKIKKPKATHPVEEPEKLFDVPNSWQWVRLGRLSLHSEAGWSPKCQDNPRENGKWAVLKVSAVTWGQFRPNENKQLPGSLSPRKELEVKPYDFLISRANTSELVARSVVVPEGAPEKLMMSDKIIRFVFSKLVDPLYLSMFNNSQFAREYYLSVAGGTSSSMKNVSRAQIQSLAVPLPPQAEQLRIVQKVDRLMVLCDKLKANLNRASTTRCQLAETIVGSALQ